jgi:hypothetical protein
MRYRKLRIAWSVGWGIVALLLTALWVRSYWWCDTVQCPTSSRFCASSVNGVFRVNIFSRGVSAGIGSSWAYNSLLTNQLPPQFRDGANWLWRSDRFMTLVVFPIWAIVLAIAVSAVVPWKIALPRSFSLRTLLIATTLVAVLLGLVGWAVR